MNYYNEYDKKTAMWLRELIKSGLIPDGIVDDRSIVEVNPDELRGYTQCHFFAGIGGWSVALQLAGWPADRPVWTGSCPCQPFSSAGKGLGDKDERHLWPVFFDLIRECRPDTVFGEQVASAIGHGWLDGISADLESEGYACGATVLGAHSVGAPHIRQRLYWVADSYNEQPHGSRPAWRGRRESANGGSDDVGLAHTCGNGRGQGGQCQPTEGGDGAFRDGIPSGLADTDGKQCDQGLQPFSGGFPERVGGNCGDSGVGNSDDEGSQKHGGSDELHLRVTNGQDTHGLSVHPSLHSWGGAVWLPFGDGKQRRIEPGISCMAHGVPARVVRLRGYGNAIVPQCAQAFIEAFLDCQD